MLGDANPSNFMISRDGVVVVDLEQARRATPRRIAWDIVTVIAYSHLMGVAVSLPEEMLKEYLEEASIPRDVLLRELLRPELLTPYIIMPIKVPEAIKAVTSTISPQPSTS